MLQNRASSFRRVPWTPGSRLTLSVCERPAEGTTTDMNRARENSSSGKKLRDDPELREELREGLDRYLDLPLALASLALVLIAIIQLGGEVEPPWDGRMEVLGWALWGLFFVEFAAKFVLAPNKRRYVTRRWLDVLVLLVPFLRFLRLLRVLRLTRAFPVFRLLVFGGRGSGATLTLLRRRRLGQLALVSVMVVLVGAALVFILENGAPGGQIKNFGDALYWSSTIVTTVGNELYPVTVGGRVLAFLLMLYAVGIFSYFIASIATVLVGLDAEQGAREGEQQEPRRRDATGVRLDEGEVEALRRILKKAGREP